MTETQVTPQNAQFAIDAKTFGQRLSLSKRQIFRLSSAGRIPKPIKIGGSVRWKLSDIELWLSMNCPTRREFEERRRSSQ